MPTLDSVRRDSAVSLRPTEQVANTQQRVSQQLQRTDALSRKSSTRTSGSQGPRASLSGTGARPQATPAEMLARTLRSNPDDKVYGMTNVRQRQIESLRLQIQKNPDLNGSRQPVELDLSHFKGVPSAHVALFADALTDVLNQKRSLSGKKPAVLFGAALRDSAGGHQYRQAARFVRSMSQLKGDVAVVLDDAVMAKHAMLQPDKKSVLPKAIAKLRRHNPAMQIKLRNSDFDKNFLREAGHLEEGGKRTTLELQDSRFVGSTKSRKIHANGGLHVLEPHTYRDAPKLSNVRPRDAVRPHVPAASDAGSMLHRVTEMQGIRDRYRWTPTAGADRLRAAEGVVRDLPLPVHPDGSPVLDLARLTDMGARDLALFSKALVRSGRIDPGVHLRVSGGRAEIYRADRLLRRLSKSRPDQRNFNIDFDGADLERGAILNLRELLRKHPAAKVTVANGQCDFTALNALRREFAGDQGRIVVDRKRMPKPHPHAQFEAAPAVRNPRGFGVVRKTPNPFLAQP